MPKKKKVILIIVVIILLIIAGCWYFIKMSRTPGNIFKNTAKGCDNVGYGYKGMCYGNLAVEIDDISFCNQMNKANDSDEAFEFNRNKCEEYYSENINLK